MAVYVRCPEISCGKMTGWSYPNFEWAIQHVGKLPTRCFLSDSKLDIRQLLSTGTLCEDPVAHVNSWLKQRLMPELPPIAELESSVDPDLGDDGTMSATEFRALVLGGFIPDGPVLQPYQRDFLRSILGD